MAARENATPLVSSLFFLEESFSVGQCDHQISGHHILSHFFHFVWSQSRSEGLKVLTEVWYNTPLCYGQIQLVNVSRRQSIQTFRSAAVITTVDMLQTKWPSFYRLQIWAVTSVLLYLACSEWKLWQVADGPWESLTCQLVPTSCWNNFGWFWKPVRDW